MQKVILGTTYSSDVFNDRIKAFDFFKEAQILGITHVDLGFGYGGGELKSSNLIGEYNTKFTDTKFEVNDKFPLWGDIFKKYNNSFKDIFDAQLEAAGVDHFDTYMLHCPFDDPDIKESTWVEAYNFMKELKRAGLVKKLGVSMHADKYKSTYVLSKLKDLGDLDSCMFSYNILNTSKEWCEDAKNEWDNPGKDGFEFAKKIGLETFCMQPLACGNVKLISTEPNIIEFALKYVSYNKNIDNVVLKTMNVEHLKQALEIFEHKSFKDEENKAA